MWSEHWCPSKSSCWNVISNVTGSQGSSCRRCSGYDALWWVVPRWMKLRESLGHFCYMGKQTESAAPLLCVSNFLELQAIPFCCLQISQCEAFCFSSLNNSNSRWVTVQLHYLQLRRRSLCQPLLQSAWRMWVGSPLPRLSVLSQ